MTKRDAPTETIMVRLNRLSQLFNSFDPSPFNEKDLDSDAEDFIVGWLRDIGDKNFRIRVSLLADEAQKAPAEDIANGIRNHFDYKLKNERRQLRLQFQRGRNALLIGLAFLTICLSLRALVAQMLSPPLEPIVGESLLILGWVAMWGPLDVFLYGWWPIVERSRLYRRLSQAEVEVRKVE
ncbi:MAG: hypothetical protein GC190_06355 [Alphaproteobacteria bacterium]|nr:hypothetical protein [Alphaproteobacteria bacterium]